MDGSLKIASLLASATEILFGLELGGHVVAVSHECDYPATVNHLPSATRSAIDSTQSSEEIDAQVRTRLTSGETLYEVDWDLLRELRPTLLVTQAQCDACSVRYEDVRRAITDDVAFAETQLLALNPTSLGEVLEDIYQVASAAGVPAAGARFVAQLQHRIDQITRQTKGIDPRQRPRVACIEWSDPVMIAGNWMPQLIEMAGGTGGLSLPGQHSQYHTWKELVEFDPEVVILMLCGFDVSRTIQEWQRTEPPLAWQDVSAIRNQRVYAADGNAYFNRSGPRLVDSLEMLAHLLHPQRFAAPSLSPGMAPAWQRWCQG